MNQLKELYKVNRLARKIEWPRLKKVYVFCLRAETKPSIASQGHVLIVSKSVWGWTNSLDFQQWLFAQG